MDETLAFYFLAGFAAQVVDGIVGMGFGTMSSVLLLAGGFPATSLSATVHSAHMFSGAASAFSHWKLRNIDFVLLRKLAPAAVLGAVAGSALLAFMPGDGLRPLLSAYFIFIGLLIAAKTAWPSLIRPLPLIRTHAVGLAGGFLDSFSGAGWGGIVTSGLLLKGRTDIQKTVGSLNTAEFMVTLTVAVIFAAIPEVTRWDAVIALAAGGVVGAPLGAWLCRKLPARPLTFAVSAAIVISGTVSLLRGL